MPELRSARVALSAFLLALLSAYVIICARIYVAARLANSQQISQIRHSTRLDPWNARPWRRLAEMEADPFASLADARAAVARNRLDAAAWLALALAQESTGERAEANRSVANALHADPTTPAYRRAAANICFSLGEQKLGLQQLQWLVTHDPLRLPSTVDLAWRATHNTGLVLNRVLDGDASAELAFLQVLTERDEQQAAAEVWIAIARQKAAFDPALAFPYVNYLLEKRQGAAAEQAWETLTRRSPEISRYRGAENLVTNGGFEENLLNSGLDWRYRPGDGTQLSSSTEAHAGARSLELDFSGAVTDPGLLQYVPVTPGTEYDFSAFYKSQALEGAGGIAWVAFDAASNAELARTDIMEASEQWRQATMRVRVPLSSDLIRLQLVRTPVGDQMRGRLWTDDVTLHLHK